MEFEKLNIRSFEKDQISDLSSIKGGKKEPSGPGQLGCGAGATCYGSDATITHWWTDKVTMEYYDLHKC